MGCGYETDRRLNLERHVRRKNNLRCQLAPPQIKQSEQSEQIEQSEQSEQSEQIEQPELSTEEKIEYIYRRIRGIPEERDEQMRREVADAFDELYFMRELLRLQAMKRQNPDFCLWFRRTRRVNEELLQAQLIAETA